MDENEKEDLDEFLERLIKRVAHNAFEELIWQLEDLVKAFDNAADRLVDEQARLDRMKGETTRSQEKPNGQDTRP